jgi:large subunit ribosomal protein L23
MAKNPYQVILRPLVTEKSVFFQSRYAARRGKDALVKYTVEVDPKATKSEIRAAMEALFPEASGHIVGVNTLRVRGKVKDPDKGKLVRRFRPGRTPNRKKAVITLKGGVTIPRLEGI